MAAAIDPKKVKEATKEGGKKGQDLCGMSELGSMRYFATIMENCDGELAYVQAAIDAANIVPDESGEERKGGASNLAKCFLSCNVQQLVMIFDVPQELQDTLVKLKEWAEPIIASVTAPAGGNVEIVEETATVLKVVVKGVPEASLYPIKMRDAAVNANFAFLRSKNMIMDDEEDVDLGALAEDAGIEW